MRSLQCVEYNISSSKRFENVLRAGMKDSHFLKCSITTKHFFLTNFITLSCRELNSLQDALRFAF